MRGLYMVTRIENQYQVVALGSGTAEPKLMYSDKVKADVLGLVLTSHNYIAVSFACRCLSLL